MSENDNEARISLKDFLLLRMIMATGTAMLVTLGLVTFLCPAQTPLNPDMCVVLTDSLVNTLVHAGIIPHAGGTIGGIAVYWLTGRGSQN